MSFASWTRAKLTGESSVTTLVSTRVTPYVRNRDADFPCIVYSVPREELESTAANADLKRTAELQIQCMSRSHLEADSIAEAVIDVLTPSTEASTCVSAVRILSLEREFADSYDGKPDLIYSTTITATLTGA